jgi:hypothetical protein
VKAVDQWEKRNHECEIQIQFLLMQREEKPMIATIPTKKSKYQNQNESTMIPFIC